MGNCVSFIRAWRLAQSPRDLHDAEAQYEGLLVQRELIKEQIEQMRRTSGKESATLRNQRNVIDLKLATMEGLVAAMELRANRTIVSSRRDAVAVVAAASGGAEHTSGPADDAMDLGRTVSLIRNENKSLETTTLSSRSDTATQQRQRPMRTARLPVHTAEPVYATLEAGLDGDDDDDGGGGGGGDRGHRDEYSDEEQRDEAEDTEVEANEEEEEEDAMRSGTGQARRHVVTM